MLQLPTATPPSTTYLLIWGIASILASGTIGVLVGLWVNRRKPKDDHAEAQARIRRDLVEADEISLRATLTFSERAADYADKQIKAQTLIFQLQNERDNLKSENERLRKGEAAERMRRSSGEH